jgi:hypothetical protein
MTRSIWVPATTRMDTCLLLYIVVMSLEAGAALCPYAVEDRYGQEGRHCRNGVSRESSPRNWHPDMEEGSEKVAMASNRQEPKSLAIDIPSARCVYPSILTDKVSVAGRMQKSVGRK